MQTTSTLFLAPSRVSGLAALGLGMAVACGDGGSGSGSGGTSTTNPPGTTGPGVTDPGPTDPSATDDPTASGGLTTTSPTGDPTSEPTTAPTTDATSTSTGEDTSTGGTTVDTTGDTTGEDTGTTGEPIDPDMCADDLVPDTMAFTLVKSFATGIPNPLLQASFYNSDLDEIVVMSFTGQAQRFTTDGTKIGNGFNVPAEALPALDGATYDPVLGRVLLLNQSCKLVEVHPVTFAVIESKQLFFNLDICAGLALGLDNNLYISSDQTEEIVVISRDGTQEVDRISMLDMKGLKGPDGVSLVAGSKNFIVNGEAFNVGLMDPAGNFLVGPEPITDGNLFEGAPGGQIDAMLTICKNGHAWLCDPFNDMCHDYAPKDGDKDACACIDDPPACAVEDRSDTLSFTAAGSFDTGIPNALLQASFYNADANEAVMMTFDGKARRLTSYGATKGPVFNVPAEALPALDGAVYDGQTGHALLINQGCKLVEVDALTFEVLGSQQLLFGLDICAGIALGLDGNLYIASDQTNEIVVISRDGSTEIRRFDVGVGNIAGVDGVSLIAGSENFLVVGTDQPTAAVFDPMGKVVVQGAPHGLNQAPLKGGTTKLLDATLTLCATGHAWVCEANGGTCWDYAPDDGDKNACQCLIPQ